MLKGKKVIVGISGGIAAYKTPFLIRYLVKEGAEAKVVASKNALQFVTKVSLETLSKQLVYSDLFADSNDYSTEHIALSDWADLCIVAPASANVIGKLANGIADDALSTFLLAFDKTIFMAPSMNTKMYNHFAVQKNLTFLKQNNIQLIEPGNGELACGWEGKGRMEEPENIISFIKESLKKKAR